MTWKWMTNEKIYSHFLNSSIKIFVLKPLCFRTINLFSGMSNDALMHREGLNG